MNEQHETAVSAPPSPPPVEPAPSRSTKNPFLAAIFSLFPGAGHIYNGLYMRAVAFFLIIATLIALASEGRPLFGFAVAFAWIFNTLDSFRQATLINAGLVHDLGLEEAGSTPKPGQGGVMAGVTMFAIGLFAIVDRYVRIDLDWMLDLWPFGLMAVGGWIAWSSIKDRNESDRADGGDLDDLL